MSNLVQRQRSNTASTKGGERYVNALTGSRLGFWEYDIETGKVFFSNNDGNAWLR